jgi:hypothetical protein
MSIKPSCAHYPGEPKEPHALQDCPSVSLYYAINRGIRFEWILTGLAHDKSACSAPKVTDDAVKNDYSFAVFCSLDYVPYLCNAEARNPGRDRGTSYELGCVPPPSRCSSRAYVLEAPLGGESAHGTSPKHVGNSNRAQHCG